MLESAFQILIPNILFQVCFALLTRYIKICRTKNTQKNWYSGCKGVNMLPVDKDSICRQ